MNSRVVSGTSSLFRRDSVRRVGVESPHTGTESVARFLRLQRLSNLLHDLLGFREFSLALLDHGNHALPGVGCGFQEEVLMDLYHLRQPFFVLFRNFNSKLLGDCMAHIFRHFSYFDLNTSYLPWICPGTTCICEELCLHVLQQRAGLGGGAVLLMIQRADKPILQNAHTYPPSFWFRCRW